ncbi:hypothetical protein [Caulobacter sp. S45]|uniref:hypothetical protein n=1 Tax=Caulobacter sp. S45 TaxID=1641861 RepID=UPI00157692CB|nr:hypothetical protein [Caulobacter sp. S45]
MTTQAPLPRRFQLSRVGELTFDIVRRDFVTSYGLAVAILIVPTVLKSVLFRGQLQSMAAPAPGRFPSVFGAGFFLAGFIGLLASLLVYAALSWRAVERLQGRAATPGAMLEAAFRALPVLIAVAILGYFAIVFATLLLIFPALMLATAWLVVVPAAACEKTGVFRTFGRSAELTKGHRWAVFWLLVVLWVASLIVIVLAALVIRAIFGLSGNIFMVQPSGPFGYVALVLQMLVSAVVYVVFGTGVGVVFQELRALKGGFDTQRLSEVFA